MTWFSEYSASPRRRLASSAIRCPSVDRFAGFSVPSRVSGQRSSLRDASLPSIGSRRARFPDFIGTMKALRLPAPAYPVPYGFGSRVHARLPVFVIAKALLANPEEARQAWNTCSAGVPCPACHTRGRVRDLTGFLTIHPMPLPCSKTPAEPARSRLGDLVDAAPGPPRPKASAGT